MKFIPLCLFTIICGYSLVISTPISHNISNLQEVKHQKITAIASRLLKELADQQLKQMESNIPKGADKIGYLITIDEESSSEGIDVDDILLNDDQELMKYLQYSDDGLKPVIDSMMKAENP